MTCGYNQLTKLRDWLRTQDKKDEYVVATLGVIKEIAKTALDKDEFTTVTESLVLLKSWASK